MNMNNSVITKVPHQMAIKKRLFLDLHNIFCKTRNFVSSYESGALRLDGAMSLSNMYRTAIKSTIQMLDQPDPEWMGNCSEDDIKQMRDELYSSEMLWGLSEAVNIRPSHHLIVIDLLEWNRECLPLSSALIPSTKYGGENSLIGSIIDELMVCERPESHDAYWNVVIRMVLGADFASAANLLQFHSAYKTDEAYAKMVKILQSLEAGIFQDRSSCDEFLLTQKKVREILTQNRIFRLYDNLRVLCSIIVGDKGTFKKYFELFRPNWFEVLPAYTLFFYPNTKSEQISTIVENLFSLIGKSSELFNTIDRTILAILNLDFLEAIKTIRTDETSWWFITHLVDFLNFHDPSFIKPLDSTQTQVERDFNMHSKLLVEYAYSLFSGQMWEIAGDYLLASGLPNAQETLGDFVGAIDWNGSTTFAQRILDVCDRYGLRVAKQDILRAIALNFAREKEWSSALEWALRTDSIDLQSKVARCILLNPDIIVELRIFDSMAEQFLTCPELIILYKFYTFKKKVSQGELREATSLLHELFLDNCSPIEFIAVLLEEVIKISATTGQTNEQGNLIILDREAILDIFRTLSTLDVTLRVHCESKDDDPSNMHVKIDSLVETLRPMLVDTLSRLI